MKTLKYTYLIVFAALTAVMAACSSDEDVVGHASERADGKVPVRLHIRVAGQSNTSSLNTRATWSDENATDDEMMNMWVVIAVHAEDDTNTPKQYEEGDIVFIHASIPEPSSREIDDLVYLLPGKYHFYSFANIDLSWLGGKGIIGYNKFANLLESSEQVELPMYFIKGNVTPQPGITYPQPGEIYNISFGSSENIKYHDIYISDSDHSEYDFGISTYTVDIDGNGFDPTNYDPEHYTDNGFGSKGIPMSNVQQNIEVTGSDDVDLIVVRMMAKIEVQVTNERATPVVINSISLTDVTDNVDDNLKLLPNYGTTPDYPGDMEAHHKDLQPNLGSGATKGNLIFTPAGDEADRTVAPGGTKSFTFYVNESVAPDNASGLFYLTLGFNGETEYHHALINQKGSTSADDDAWHYIARNDYRIIPVHLTDWLFRIEPIAFAPIAGYPAVTVRSNAQTATFSTGGMIALQPFVKKKNDATWRDFDDVEVTYGEVVPDDTDPTKDDVEKSWNASISWTNANGVKQSGDGKILTTPFTYDPATKCIIGELNNNLPAGTYKTAVTIKLKLGPLGNQYTYSFTCDVVLQK